MLVLNCYGLKGSVHCTPSLPSLNWESRDGQKCQHWKGPRSVGLAALFPSERQTPPDRGWAQIEASPGPLALASSNIEGQAVRASCRLPHTPEAAEEANLCPPGSLSQTQRSPALTRERVRRRLWCVYPHMETWSRNECSPNKCDKCSSSLFWWMQLFLIA